MADLTVRIVFAARCGMRAVVGEWMPRNEAERGIERQRDMVVRRGWTIIIENRKGAVLHRWEPHAEGPAEGGAPRAVAKQSHGAAGAPLS